jgi:3-(methylthio)propanoyl-CoA dehydrogenase
MADNFYLDNDDLRFQIETMTDWNSINSMREDFSSEECPFENVEEAREANIDMLTDPVGSLAAERIAPRAEEIDREGCKLENGQVIFPDGVNRNMADLKDAQLSGITMGTEYGGMGFSKTFYASAIEIVSRADASLMNLFSLQGIGETIEHFASDELKDMYLPGMAAGDLTGAMVLTEADAGSDLAASRTSGDLLAGEDPITGEWKVKGTKRFITNGCGDVLLVLARSEDPQKLAGSRGLSFFLVEKSEKVQVRRIEEKLGIHGSPTCELYFDDAPARLIGKRGRGLTKYTAWLMGEARLGVAAQAVGIAEASLREAQKYGEEREQFGQKIKTFPAVGAMLTDMRVATEASRALLYATSYFVDMKDGTEAKNLKAEGKKYSRAADLFTPLVKYYAAEICSKVSYDSIQIHGGNGFMVDYPAERLYRDARITSIYEGTSQIQIEWALPRIIRGDLDPIIQEWAEKARTSSCDPELFKKAAQINDCLNEAISYLRDKDKAYRALMARRLADLAIATFLAYHFLVQSSKWDYKKKIAARYILDTLPLSKFNLEILLSDRPLDLEMMD